MVSFSWLRRLQTALGIRPRNRRKPLSRPHSFRPVVKRLEDRTLLSAAVVSSVSSVSSVTTVPIVPIVPIVPVVSVVPVVTNTGFTVARGGAAVAIDQSQLQATETGVSDPTQLTFTINLAPTHGVLKKNGTTLGAGGTFTQADINNHLVTYQNTDTTATGDFFTATVSGPGGGSSGTTATGGSFTPAVSGLGGGSTGPFTVVISFSQAVSVKAVSNVHDSSGTSEFVQFQDGTVFRHTAGNATLAPVTSDKTDAISAGLDANGHADVTVLFNAAAPEGHTLWTYTNTGRTQLVFTAEANKSATIRSFVAGMNGVVDVVFSDNTLWQGNLGSPTHPTQVANKLGTPVTNVNFVAVGLHNGQQAVYVALQDNGPTSNGGVWEYIGPGQAWIPVTSMDVYAISASWDLSDTADLIVSNRNHALITDHSDWAWRGTPNSVSVITSLAVSSVSVNALGNDFYVLQSTGSLYEHRAADPITMVTALVTAPPVPVTAVLAPNGATDVVDFVFANSTLWQVSGLTTLEGASPTPNLHHTPLAS